MDDEQKYDAIIIGAGQGGMPLANLLAGKGWKTALVERKYVGGTCINYGCTPTKTMVASAGVAYLARRAAEFGVQTGDVSVDLVKVRQRKRDMVESFRASNLRRINNSGVELIEGTARFTAPKSLLVDLNAGGSLLLNSEKIFINTGGRTRVPALPGLDQVPWLDSTSLMELDQVPEHLLVVGGGYIGVEFGQMFRRFGSRVTIVQRAPQLLPLEDLDIAEKVAEILQEDGIEILFQASPTQVSQTRSGRIALTVEDAASKRLHVLTGTHLLLAVGRVPNTEDLDLSAAGVALTERGHIRVNEKLETSVPGIYAIGDVKGGPEFTHISYDDFRVLRANLLEGREATIHDRPVPYTVFIDPQLGRVGLSEKQARAQERRYRVARLPMDYIARALEIGQSRGMMKALVDADTDLILGCAVLGVEGGEIMAMLQIAMLGKLRYQDLRDAIFTHPTLSESLNTLFTMFADA